MGLNYVDISVAPPIFTETTIIPGKQGIQGIQGDPGVFVGTTEPTDESVKVWINPDGMESDIKGDKGDKGDTGNGISAIEIAYNKSTSNTTAPTAGWVATPPSVAAGSYLWTRLTITMTEGNPVVAYTVAKQGVKGDTGAAAGFGTPTATIDGNVGTPEVKVTSCDATVEQIDEAVAAEKKVVLNASVDGLIIELQMVQYVQGDASIFSAFLSGMVIYSSVYKVGNESKWNFEIGLIPANSVDYSNAALPSISTVGDALDKLVTKSHTHSNKDTLDNLSVSNGKLQYNGSDVGLKPSQVTTGTNITLADNTEYRLTDVTTLTLTYPTGDFECWMRLSFAASGEATVILPTGTTYIGAAPDFKNGETWEMSIKDGVVIAQKVGDGSMTPIETVEDGTEVSY